MLNFEPEAFHGAGLDIMVAPFQWDNVRIAIEGEPQGHRRGACRMVRWRARRARRRQGRFTLNLAESAECAEQARGSLDELLVALNAFEADAGIGAIVLTGSEKAFAAGADIKEMQIALHVDVYLERLRHQGVGAYRHCRKPMIAAVAGFALGGGCELAMMCDFIIAADKREVRPAGNHARRHARRMGGTQRLTRASASRRRWTCA
jgi:enoyl-CoA hydratase/carnithine racemase